MDIGGGAVDNFQLKQETTGISSNAARVLEGMIEFSLALNYFSTAVHPPRCRANMVHIRRSRPESGLSFQVEILLKIEGVSFPLGRGPRESLSRGRTS